jgi:hypothetical protein
MTEITNTIQFYGISASNETLLRQASMTATEYLDNAVQNIDERFGKGYAKAHPELIGAFMQTAAADLGGAVIARAIQDGFEGVAHAITEGYGSEAQRTDHPLMGETLDGITNALQQIAEALSSREDE